MISALHLIGLIPDLIELSANDVSGLSYLTLNTLSDDFESLRRLYAARVITASMPAQVVLIDALARLRHPLPFTHVRRLLNEGHEVQEATLAYVRTFAVQWGDDRYLSTVTQTLGHYADERRIQALLIASELPPSRRGPFALVRVRCPHDRPDAIRPWCMTP